MASNEKAADFFESMEIPFEVNALSAHRTPDEVEKFAKKSVENGIKVIIAGAGMASHFTRCNCRYESTTCYWSTD